MKPPFDPRRIRPQKVFGGELLKGNARSRRPLSYRHAIHLTLRSQLCRGRRSLLHPKRVKRINSKVRELCRETHVRLYEYANVGNHLHLLIRVPDRAAYCRLVRSLTGVIARMVLNAEKGRASAQLSLRKKFWDTKPFTRLIEWGRDFGNASRYVRKNLLEACSMAYHQAFGRLVPLISWSG